MRAWVEQERDFRRPGSPWRGKRVWLAHELPLMTALGVEMLKGATPRNDTHEWRIVEVEIEVPE